MGSSNSSRRLAMEDGEVVEPLALADQADTDIAQLLQYLIRSGQVHIIATDGDDDSEDEVHIVRPSSRITPNPVTDVLDKSSFKVMTRAAAGLSQRNGRKRTATVAGLLSARQRGLPVSSSFSVGDRCRLMNDYLPNKKTEIASGNNKIFCGSYSKDGNVFLTAGQDRKLRIFDSRTSVMQQQKVIAGRGVGWSILDTAFSPDGMCFAYSSWSESVHLCSLYGNGDEQENLVICPVERRFCVFSLAFSSDGNEILCGANDGCIYVYDRSAQRNVLKIPSHDDDVNSVAFADETSQIVYSGGDDGIVKVWDRRTLSETDPEPVGMLAGHMDGITYIEARGDGRHLLSNSKDQSIKLWDVRVFSSDEALEHTKKAVEDQVWDYRWQGIPKVLKNPRKRVPGDSSIMTYCGHTVLQTLCRCHFSPAATTGQRYIYTGCASGRVIIYDTLTGLIVRELNGHRGCVRDVAWHPYRPEITSTSWDGKIYQWTYTEGMEDDSEAALQPAQQPVRRSQRIIDRMNKLRARLIDPDLDRGQV